MYVRIGLDDDIMCFSISGFAKFDSSFFTKLIASNQSTYCGSQVGITCNSSSYVTGLDLSDESFTHESTIPLVSSNQHILR